MDGMNEIKLGSARFAILANPFQFQPGFIVWIEDNTHVYAEFERSALNVIQVGFRHYSARTIFENLRHRSNLREISGNYKLNNSVVADLSRLFSLLNPAHKDLFERRSSRLRIAA